MKEHCWPWIAAFAACALPLRAADVSFQPPAPTVEEVIRIEVRGCTQPGMLHWGVNARGNEWKQAIPAYRPAGSAEEGIATRTPLEGPDENGVCRVALGPFNDTNQPVASLDFVFFWQDGSWDSAGGRDYHIPVTRDRVRVTTERPTLNDTISVLVRRAAAGGQLRWGVNADRGRWNVPATNYWPPGSVPSDDGLAVDSPLPPPDAQSNTAIRLGPFNQPGLVVTTLHMAAHWGDDWDTDFGRNYNAAISLESGPADPAVKILWPPDGAEIEGGFAATAAVERAGSVTFWVDGSPMVTYLGPPYEWAVAEKDFPLGRHVLIVSAENVDGAGALRVGMAQAECWRVPPVRREPAPEGLRPGATVNADGTVTFALHAPGKHFVSVVGDFNGWDPAADLMNRSPDGTWWLRRPLEKGRHLYQYGIEGKQFLADPYSRDVEWKDEKGEETHRPEQAKTVLAVGEEPFAWTDGDFRRPPLDSLVIYELNIDDFCPGQGFTGVIARLDYIRDLGVTAIEPLPVNEFPGRWSWGYNPAFHFAPETAYGTPEEFKRLVNEAHRRGLAVVLDMVLNHMEWNSPLMQLYGLDYDASPYFHDFKGENWGFPDLRQDSPAFKQYAADLLRFWIEEYHADGYRFDATRWVGWQGYNDWGASWFAYAVKQADTGAYRIAEHLPEDPALHNRTEMQAGWNSFFRWRLRDMIRNARVDRADFEKLMDPAQMGFSNACQRVAYIESHDEERFLRELRDAHYSEAEALLRDQTALAITLTAPGVLMVYAGQEFGEATPKQLALNPLHWNHLEDDAFKGLHRTFRTLARLRADNPALRSGDIVFQTNNVPENVVVYERRGAGAAVLVAANFGKTPAAAPVEFSGEGKWVNALQPDIGAVNTPETRSMVLLPGAAVVFSRNP